MRHSIVWITVMRLAILLLKKLKCGEILIPVTQDGLNYFDRSNQIILDYN